MREILAILVAGMGGKVFSNRYREFVADFTEELDELSRDVPEVAVLAANITRLATTKDASSHERGTGMALFRVIRDKWGETLKSASPILRPVSAPPPLPTGVTITRCLPIGENGKPDKLKAAKAAKKAESPDTSEAHAERVRMVLNLPPVNVTVVPSLRRAAARHEFFAMASRCECNQSGLVPDDAPIGRDAPTRKSVDAKGKEITVKGKDAIEHTDFAAVAKRTRSGIDPRVILTKHRDIIGSNPEGLRILTAYEHHAIGPFAALDMARRVLSTEHKGTTFAAEVRYWDCWAPNGVPTPELIEARRVAALPAAACVVMYSPKGQAVMTFQGHTFTRKGAPIQVHYPESDPPLLYPVKEPRRKASGDE